MCPIAYEITVGRNIAKPLPNIIKPGSERRRGGSGKSVGEGVCRGGWGVG